MEARWRDVSIPMHPGMTVWPGDQPFTLRPASRIASGDECNVSIITLSTHTGTHVDAPWHFEEDGARLDAIGTDLFFGDALLIECMDTDLVRAGHLPEAPLPPRVLFKTRNAQHDPADPFHEDYVALSEDAAQRLADDGVRLVGVDYLSVAPYKQPGQGTHHILLQNGVLIVEGLRLGGIAPGTYPFTVLPLPLRGADGAPCRAFLYA